MDADRLTAAVVVVHLAANGLHGVVHETAVVPLRPWQVAFVALVVVVAPVVALVVVRRGAIRAGGWLLAGSIAGSLAFGGYFHYLSSTADHVGAVTGPWSGAFAATAATLVVVDAVGTAAGLAIARGVGPAAEESGDHPI